MLLCIVLSTDHFLSFLCHVTVDFINIKKDKLVNCFGTQCPNHDSYVDKTSWYIVDRKNYFASFARCDTIMISWGFVSAHFARYKRFGCIRIRVGASEWLICLEKKTNNVSCYSCLMKKNLNFGNWLYRLGYTNFFSSFFHAFFWWLCNSSAYANTMTDVPN